MASELITAVTGAKRPSSFMTSGRSRVSAFSTYSLTEIAAYMRNNAMLSFLSSFGSMRRVESCSSSPPKPGAGCTACRPPGGMIDVVRDIKGRRLPVYTLRYRSLSQAGFGDKYIPLEIEVTRRR